MKKAWKYALLGAAAVALIPFKIKREENGDFDYRSLLFGISKKTDAANGEPEISLHFFNLPEFKSDDDLFDDEWDVDEAVTVVDDKLENAAEKVEDAVEDSFSAN